MSDADRLKLAVLSTAAHGAHLFDANWCDANWCDANWCDAN
ncbi:MAG: hypothetical protein AAFQ67_05415 [Pseudomonadota bacterium]